MAADENDNSVASLSPELQRILLQLGEENASKRAEAVKELSEMGSSLSLVAHALLRTLENKTSPLRIGAAVALGAAGGATAVPALVKALGDEDRELSAVATNSLVNIGLPAVTALTDALSDTSLNIEAMVVLGKLDPSIAKTAVPILEAQLDTLLDSESPMKFMAAAALAQTSGPKNPGWQKGGDVLHEGILGPAVFQAMGALRFIPTAVAVPALVEILSRQDAELRSEAMDTLEAIGKETVPLLLEALGDTTDSSPQVFVSICNVLARLGKFSQEAVPMLMQKVMSGPTVQRCAALDALGNVGEAARPAMPLLSNIASDGDTEQEVRDHAIDAIRKLEAE